MAACALSARSTQPSAAPRPPLRARQPPLEKPAPACFIAPQTGGPASVERRKRLEGAVDQKDDDHKRPALIVWPQATDDPGKSKKKTVSEKTLRGGWGGAFSQEEANNPARRRHRDDVRILSLPLLFALEAGQLGEIEPDGDEGDPCGGSRTKDEPVYVTEALSNRWGVHHSGGHYGGHVRRITAVMCYRIS